MRIPHIVCDTGFDLRFLGFYRNAVQLGLPGHLHCYRDCNIPHLRHRWQQFPSLSFNIGDKAATALPATMNILSVTRLAPTASILNLMPGKIYELPADTAKP